MQRESEEGRKRWSRSIEGMRMCTLSGEKRDVGAIRCVGASRSAIWTSTFARIKLGERKGLLGGRPSGWEKEANSL